MREFVWCEMHENSLKSAMISISTEYMLMLTISIFLLLEIQW